MTQTEFWIRAELDDEGCVRWRGARHSNGYKNSYIDGRHITAHRAAWTFAHGPIPRGMHVLHRCDVRECVNPEHLFLGTNADNMIDKMSKGRCRNQWSKS